MALEFLSPIHKASRQMALYLEGRCAAHGVSTVEGHILTYLEKYAPASIGELHRVFGHKRSTLTSILDRLEDRDLVLRGVDEKDRRSFVVALTAKGKPRAIVLREILMELEKKILSRVDRKDLEGFGAVMRVIGEVTKVEVKPRRSS